MLLVSWWASRTAQGWIFGDRPALWPASDFVLDSMFRRAVRWMLVGQTLLTWLLAPLVPIFCVSLAAVPVIIGACWAAFAAVEVHRLRGRGQLEALSVAEAAALRRGRRLTCWLAGVDVVVWSLCAAGT